MKRLLLRLAAIVFGLTLALLVLEAGLRLLGALDEAPPERRVAVYEEHSKAANLPSDRVSPRPTAKAQRFRIMVLGDSFTWGTGVYVEDTYPRRLEILLERMNQDLDVRLIMASRPGWNTELEYEAATGANPWPRPDLIVLGYCLNDTETKHRRGMEKLTQRLDRRQLNTRVSRFFTSRSHLAALLWNRLENSRQRQAFDRYYRRIYQPDFFSHTELALDKFRQLAWDWHAPIVVVVFPVFDQQFDRDYSYGPAHERIAEALRQRDIPYLDLLDAYRGVDTLRLAAERFSDPHPNELAHRIASQRLANFLVEQHVVPVTPEQRDRVELSLERGKTKKRKRGH